jgi:hypothetical protein
MAERRALSFPKWVEGTLVVGFVAMAVVEFLHDQWMWAGIFGIAGALFGASLVVRVLWGEEDSG